MGICWIPATEQPMIQRSRDHLASNGMTYAEHMRFASSHGAACIRAGLRLLVHAVVPGVWQTAGGRLLGRLQGAFTPLEDTPRESVH